jgi:hypothetical protein
MIGSAYNAVLTQLVAPIVVAIIVLVLIVAALYSAWAKLPVPEVVGFSVPFGFLGGISGLIAGATSEPIVGAFLTGLLGLVSGALSLIIAKQATGSVTATHSSDIAVLVGPAIVVLCLTALAGLAIGRVYQMHWVTYERSYQETKDLNEKVNMPLARIWKQYEYCRSKVKDPHTCDVLLLKAN